MYLHKLTPSLRHPQARKDLASRYELHRTLATALASEEGTPPADRYLWRVDLDSAGTASILVQTTQPVDWSPLERRHHGYCEDIKANKSMATLAWQRGGMFRFRLHASPSRMVDKRRMGLVLEGDQMAWMNRVAKEGGFELVDCDRRSGYLEKQRKSDGHQIVLAVGEFDGVLLVQDAEKFTAALRAGIGRGKAFGFGMLSLAPATS